MNKNDLQGYLSSLKAIKSLTASVLRDLRADANAGTGLDGDQDALVANLRGEIFEDMKDITSVCEELWLNEVRQINTRAHGND